MITITVNSKTWEISKRDLEIYLFDNSYYLGKHDYIYRYFDNSYVGLVLFL